MDYTPGNHRHGPFGIVDQRVVHDPTLSHGAVRLYVALALHAFKDGRARPKVKTLETCSGLDRRSLQRARKELVDGGHIRVVPFFHPDGGQGSNEYTLVHIVEAALAASDRGKGGDTQTAPLDLQYQHPGPRGGDTQTAQNRESGTALDQEHSSEQGAQGGDTQTAPLSHGGSEEPSDQEREQVARMLSDARARIQGRSP